MGFLNNLTPLDSILSIISSVVGIFGTGLGIYVSLLKLSPPPLPTQPSFPPPPPLPPGSSQPFPLEWLGGLLHEAESDPLYATLMRAAAAFGVIAAIFFILLCFYFTSHPLQDTYSYYYPYYPYTREIHVYNNNWIGDVVLAILAVVSVVSAIACGTSAEKEANRFIQVNTQFRIKDMDDLKRQIEILQQRDPSRQKTFLERLFQ